MRVGYTSPVRDVYENACDNADCECRTALDWPDNIRNGCKHKDSPDTKSEHDLDNDVLPDDHDD